MVSKEIKEKILRWYEIYHKPEYLRIDPLVSVRKLIGKDNREIGALLASSIAYGKVEIIIKNCEWLLTVMKWQPFEFIFSTDLKEKKKLFKGFRHRFNDTTDIALLLQTAGTIIKRYGSLEKFFLSGFSNGDQSIKTALTKFTEGFRNTAVSKSNIVLKSFEYLFPSPESGSACKRLNMFLRWVVREDDSIDLGIWKGVKPSLLVMPVDVHVANQARQLKLTQRKSADWKMAEEITDHLRNIDSVDPVKFDFSICRAGMVLASGDR